jgi:hypothetical protein
VLVAADVDRDPRVQEFRNRVLGGGLLRGSTAREWIEQRARRRQLSGLARKLAEETGWTSGQAALYLLTDDVPYLPAFEQTYVYRRRSGTSRVIISVDPARSPGEVAEIYGRLRRRVVGQRHRDLTEKHLWLAMFAVMRSHKESIAAQMVVWNKSFPTWKYDNLSNFGRDRGQARRRILHPPFAAEVGDSDFYRKLGYGAGDAEQLAKLDLEELLLSGEDTMMPRRRFA